MASRRLIFPAVTTRSAAETEALGGELGRKIHSGLCIALVGGLGAGKTVFARGLCRGLGVSEDVLSPTFVLYEEFEGRLGVIHLDLYRLGHESDIEALGVFDQLGGDKVIVIEWGDRSDTLMASSDLVVTIHPRSERTRQIVYEGTADVRLLLEET
jgi:tRNA threonylcarbamoyladenosine biosynthesis protein TsaE